MVRSTSIPRWTFLGREEKFRQAHSSERAHIYRSAADNVQHVELRTSKRGQVPDLTVVLQVEKCQRHPREWREVINLRAVRNPQLVERHAVQRRQVFDPAVMRQGQAGELQPTQHGQVGNLATALEVQ